MPADERTIQLALAHLERTAGRRRKCRRCGQAMSSGDRDRAPVLAPALGRAEPQLRGLEVDVLRAERERF